MIRVLIVDDSPTSREYLRHIIASDENLEVAGVAEDGREAVELAEKKRPDVITMDIQMPRMDGYEATRLIMERCPVPIVVISSSLIPEQVKNTFRAIRAGAVAALEKPRGPGHPESGRMVAKIIQTVKLMSEVRVIRRYSKRQKDEMGKVPHRLPKMADMRLPNIKLVAIGASTGGPPVIRSILSRLDRTFPVPLLFVQHISPGFLQGMTDWLGKETDVSVEIPRHGDLILPGAAYFAPDGYHMGITRKGEIILSKKEPIKGLRPAVSYLFSSVGEAFGAEAMGILLTGMGKDGAPELKMMRDKGALTIAQDKESSVVHGMPGEAIKLGAAKHIFSSEEIASFLVRMKDKI